LVIEYENLKRTNESFFEEFKAAFTDVLDSGWFVLGSRVAEFENRFADYIDSKHCIGVASGLDALVLSLKSLDFPPGAEVLVPSNTYIATILAVLQCGLTPVLVEPDPMTYNIDPARLESQITSRSRAILVVHLYGKPCAMDQIAAVADKHGLRLFEDCAQSHGATFKGKMTGTFGTCGAFSFYPTKNLGALGDGGAVATSDEQLALKLRQLRNYGSSVKYHNDLIGYNSRLDEIQAAFLSIKLSKLDLITAHKRTLATVYLEGIKDDFVKPVVNDDCFDVYHLFTVRHPRRDQVREHLLASGIKTEVHYPVPPHRQKALQGLFPAGDFPISEEIHSTIMSLPISYFHSKQDAERVVEVLNTF
jgi:dTDP-4-amino-4,6-dideoxygalactose transaminase